MQAVEGLPPQMVKDLLVKDGWVVVEETDNIWILVDNRSMDIDPLPIPKHGRAVDPLVMDWLCRYEPRLGHAFATAAARYIAEQTP